MESFINFAHTIAFGAGLVVFVVYYVARNAYRRSVSSLSWVPTQAIVTKRQQEWCPSNNENDSNDLNGSNHCIVYYSYVFNQINHSHRGSWMISRDKPFTEMEPSLEAFELDKEIQIFVDPANPLDTALEVKKDMSSRLVMHCCLGIGLVCLGLLVSGMYLEANLASSWAKMRFVVQIAAKAGFFVSLIAYIYCRISHKRLKTVAAWQPATGTIEWLGETKASLSHKLMAFNDKSFAVHVPATVVGYRYSWGDASYTGKVTEGNLNADLNISVKRVLSDYPEGKRIAIWVDPKNPQASTAHAPAFAELGGFVKKLKWFCIGSFVVWIVS
jgi:hypothetical protein